MRSLLPSAGHFLPAAVERSQAAVLASAASSTFFFPPSFHPTHHMGWAPYVGDLAYSTLIIIGLTLSRCSYPHLRATRLGLADRLGKPTCFLLVGFQTPPAGLCLAGPRLVVDDGDLDT